MTDVPSRPGSDRIRGELSEKGQRQVAEQDLRESEERYRMLVEQVQDYAIFMLDPQGRVVSWNAGAELIKGYQSAEIIGENFSRFYPAEDRERGTPEEVLRSAAATGRHTRQKGGGFARTAHDSGPMSFWRTTQPLMPPAVRGAGRRWSRGGT